MAKQETVVEPTPKAVDMMSQEEVNTELEKLADWTRHYIRDDELAKSQLPSVVPTKKKAARKPLHW